MSPRENTPIPAEPSVPGTEAQQAEITADKVSVLRSLDTALGMPTVALAMVGTYLAFTGATQIWIAVLLWSVPILNLAWSRIPSQPGPVAADTLRAALFLPITTTIYAGAGGALQHMWIPALAMVVGISVGAGVATRPRVGYLVTLSYVVSLPLGVVIAGDTITLSIVADMLTVALVGFTVSMVALNLGRSLADARNRRSDAEASRAEVETTLRRLAAAQQQLVQSARASGRAEVATSVLHNVGNVLNSVGVAAEMATAALADSRLSSLQKGVELLRSHSDDLTSFVATEKGRIVPEFLAKATKAVADAVARAAGELSAQRLHIEHIKVVIASQQAHARRTTCTETFELGPVVGAAVNVGIAGRAPEGIEIHQDLEDLPPLTTDRHKLLQILINLVGNARQAVRDANTHTGRIEIRARLQSGDRLRIEVRDDGVGIDRETMRQLFRHGFTTREGGHGFGLHSSANTATELGGSLHAESDGKGCGAVFVLEIPMVFGVAERQAA